MLFLPYLLRDNAESRNIVKYEFSGKHFKPYSKGLHPLRVWFFYCKKS